MTKPTHPESDQTYDTTSMIEGYVFCADLLGFKNIIENLSAHEASQRVKIWIDFVNGLASHYQITRYQFFSDTIVATGTLQNLIGFSQELLSSGIEKSLLIRGAISYGEFSWIEREILYGNALLEAYKLQESQDWIGVSVLNKNPVEEHVSDELVTYPCPLKKGAVRLHDVVKWVVPISQELFSLMTKNGFTKNGELLAWDTFMNKAANTALFGWYLRTMKQFPDIDLSTKFRGLHPIQFMEYAVEEELKAAEIKFKTEEKRAIAKACFAKGLDIQTVSSLTGLTEGELEKGG